MQSMYGSYSIAVVEAGVWVVALWFVVAAVAKAAVIVVKAVEVVAVGEVAAEAEPVPVVDWQVKEIVLDAEDLESRLGKGPNIVVGPCCLDHP
jgi:hypothetical protein